MSYETNANHGWTINRREILFYGFKLTTWKSIFPYKKILGDFVIALLWWWRDIWSFTSNSHSCPYFSHPISRKYLHEPTSHFLSLWAYYQCVSMFSLVQNWVSNRAVVFRRLHPCVELSAETWSSYSHSDEKTSSFHRENPCFLEKIEAIHRKRQSKHPHFFNYVFLGQQSQFFFVFVSPLALEIRISFQIQLSSIHSEISFSTSYSFFTVFSKQKTRVSWLIILLVHIPPFPITFLFHSFWTIFSLRKRDSTAHVLSPIPFTNCFDLSTFPFLFI